MTVSELCDRATSLLELVAKKSVKSASEAKEVIDGLTRLKGWAYPHLTTDDITKVVRCKNCSNYKKFKKKDDRKAAPFWACSLDKVKRPPDFYCAGGVEK